MVKTNNFDLSEKQRMQSFKNFFIKYRTIIALIILLFILCIVNGFLLPSFLSVTNFLNVLRQVSVTGIIAVGMSFVIISGGIDISVGSILAMSGIIVTMALKNYNIPLTIAILIALIVSVALGLLNGLIIAYGRVLPFVATLGTMYLIRGLALILSGGRAISDLSDQFITIGRGFFLKIPIPIIIAFVVYIFGHFILTQFTFGRYVLGIGGNEESARLCGVAIKKVKLLVYGFCGLLCGIAGVVLAARLGSGQPNVGSGYELIAIAAAVIGGNSLSGGKGSIFGTLLGALMLGVVSNALNLWGVASFYQTVVTGGIVLVAVLADKAVITKDKD